MRNKLGALMTALFVILLTSCENNLDEVYNEEQSRIPISFTAQILEANLTRMTGNNFEEGDLLSLYILQQPNRINETRYQENVKLTYNNGYLKPEKEIFFPYGKNVKCDFLSFYPYSETKIEEQGKNIPIKVEPNQISKENYSHSDFLVAKETGIQPTNNPVNLDHKHVLSQITFCIQLPDTTAINKLVNDIKITLDNVKTTAEYDIEGEQLNSMDTPASITPYGRWNINKENAILSGKRIILIPQAMKDATISLLFNNKTYISKLPQDLITKSGSSYEIVLNFAPNTGIESMKASITKWKYEESISLDVQENSLQLQSLNFAKYGIYDIYGAYKDLKGSVCMEYLKNNDIDSQAIVYYPKENPLEGTVLELIGEKGTLHGGKVVWNKGNNTFSYTPGEKAAIQTLFIDENGHVVFDEPLKADCISAEEQVLVDKRGNETFTYPIVKIGCQYFMKESLKTTKYIDGQELENQSMELKDIAGYATFSGYVFYNHAAATSKKLAPKGWKIPTVEDWGKLSAYVENVAAKLKTTNGWEPQKGISAGNNITGFDGYPEGYVCEKHMFIGMNRDGWYWADTDNKDAIFRLNYQKNDLKFIPRYDKDYITVRCIRIEE